MLIKNNSLEFIPPKKTPAVYILLGEDLFQIMKVEEAIKTHWPFADSCETTTLSITNTNDWLTLAEEVRSLSLFASHVLVAARFDKKTIDQAGKNFFTHYLEKPNPRCLVVFRAQALAVKALQTLATHEQVQVIHSSLPAAKTIKHWICAQLHSLRLSYEPEIPDLIYQYTEGNLLATAQVIEKLGLCSTAGEKLSVADLKAQLVDQSAYDLFDLAKACLTGDLLKALQLLRQAHQNKTEATLILWLFTQEIRRVLVLQDKHSPLTFAEKAHELKLWSNQLSMYQQAANNWNNEHLTSALHFCNKLDLQIKTSQSNQIWQSFELLALSLCTGKRVGHFA